MFNELYPSMRHFYPGRALFSESDGPFARVSWWKDGTLGCVAVCYTRHNVPEANVMSSNVLFCLPNGPALKISSAVIKTFDFRS